MRHLSIDIETRSSADIGKTGLYRYAQDKDFGILLFAYKLDEDPVKIVDLEMGEKIPDQILKCMSDPSVTKHAYNAAFEWYCLNRAGYHTPLAQWKCTMIHGLYCGYTAGLDATGKAIGLPQDKQKLTTGKALIRYFCVPCKPTKSNGGRTWNLPRHAPEKWKLFKEYCVQDVVTESEILKRLSAFPVPETEERLWQMDVRMNAFGVRVDTGLIAGALMIDGISTQELTDEAVEITGLSNPNSTGQVLQWLTEQGVQMENLQKATVEETLTREALPKNVRRILEIRQQLGKTSVKKYTAMQTAKCEDDRIRGLTQFYGANRTEGGRGGLCSCRTCPETT